MKKQPVLIILVGVALLVVVGVLFMKGLGLGFKGSKIPQATIAVAPTPSDELDPAATAEVVIGDAATLNADGSSNGQVDPKINSQQKSSSNNTKIVVNSNTNNNTNTLDTGKDNQVSNLNNQSVENQAAEAFQAKVQKKKTTATVTVNQDGKTTVVISKKDQVEEESDERSKKLINKTAGLDEIADEFSH